VEPSYKPGVHPPHLAEPGRESLPGYALDAIREALPAFERQIRGFAMADAVLTGVEDAHLVAAAHQVARAGRPTARA
jgi:uncharacterized FAD-dependent dehydrogenase